MPIKEDLPFYPVRIAVLTVSDSRGPAEDRSGENLQIDGAFVDKQLSGIARDTDLSRYVL